MSGKKRDAKTIEIQQRRIKALELRRQGYSYRVIGATLGIEESQAHRDIMAALKKLAAVEQTKADEMRQLEVTRLDSLYLSLEPMIRARNLGAIDRALKIIEQRSRLLGLPLPSKVEHSGSVGLRWEDVMKANDDGSSTPDPENPFS